MTLRPYPDGFDHAWLASDRAGNVGMFITAGQGPMPEAALDREFNDVEDLALKLPQTGSARVLKMMPHPDSFLALAERGLFVFDWSDVHRTTAEAIRAYELAATPDRPINVGKLSPLLVKAANAVALDKMLFSGQSTIDVAAQLRCVGPS